jgi:hypothetical protein
MALPMLMEIGLERGFQTALSEFILMQLQLAPVFFTSLCCAKGRESLTQTKTSGTNVIIVFKEKYTNDNKTQDLRGSAICLHPRCNGRERLH